MVLADLSIERNPLYQFDFDGALTLNGPATRPRQLHPEETITLDRGLVNYLESRFLLNRRNRNTIVFTPERGLFDPRVDIQLRTIVSEFNRTRNFQFARPSGIFPSNEIPDDSLNRVQRIDVYLTLQGDLSNLLPNLARGTENVCNNIRSETLPFPENRVYTREELNRLETCIRAIALTGEKNGQTLYSPFVSLSSSHPRSEGEIISLLSGQVLSVVEQLQGKNTGELIQYGVVQLALPLLAQNILYDVEYTLGNAVGAADFTILPNLETAYRVGKQDFVRFSYDYTYNEFTIRYETRF